jgi:GT2 family glycosyltransferase
MLPSKEKALLSPAFFLGIEEYDYYAHAIGAGFKVVTCPM